jgi:hypothetical protein
MLRAGRRRTEPSSAKAKFPSHLPTRGCSRLAVGIDPIDGWSGVIAVNVRSPDDETARGLVELGRIVSRLARDAGALAP